MGMSAFAERILAGRWIAGPEASDAIRVSRRLNSVNISAILNYLGEDLKYRGEIRDAVHTYLHLMNLIKSGRINASLSIKPSQIGLSINYELARYNYSYLAKAARSYGVFLWMDMESHSTVNDTLRMYKSELRNGNVGICLQAYLRRSMDDLKDMVRLNGTIRLVKGAYKEGSDVAFPTREQITKNYSSMMGYLFRKARSRHFMIATHDPSMVLLSLKLEKSTGKKPMYAMLNGIRNNYASRLARREQVSLYVPFGRAWIPYASRRLREEGHFSLIIKSLLERQDLV